MSTRSPTLMAAAASPAHSKPAAPVYSQAAAVVSGMRASVGKSLEVKCESQTVVHVLAAEDDEALQRVSGVSISREFGEGERVSMRGTVLQRTLLNGHAIATADGFVVDPLAATGSASYLIAYIRQDSVSPM